MISHAKISRHRHMFKTFTGLSTEGFKQILASFEEDWEADLDRRDAGRLRLRGRGFTDRLVFIRVYFQLYPIQAVQGLLFGMSQPQSNEWVHRLTPFLNAALAATSSNSQPASPGTSRRCWANARESSSSSTEWSAPSSAPRIPSGKDNSTAARRSATASRTTSSLTGAPGRSRGSAPPAWAINTTKDSLTSRLCASPKAQSSGRIPAFRVLNPQGSRPCKQRRNPRGANSAPKIKRPIGVSPSYGCASNTASPESRSSVASVTFIATSKRALRTP
jgi:hypothetical protein